MDYDVSVSEDSTYILIDIHQPMSNELGRRCGADAVALAEQYGLNHYLFDSRGAPNIEDPFLNYDFAYKEMEGFDFPHNSRSALLVDPDDASHNFMETVFLNAGYQVKLFTDKNEAIAWLNE